MNDAAKVVRYTHRPVSDAWEGYQAALASRPATIDPIHGEKREVIINALCASSNWMRGYAEAFVDDFVDGRGWQPIESAPKDGTPVDLWVPGRRDGRLINMRRVKIGKHNVFYEAVEVGPSCVRDATHWMPLPEPPK